MKQAVIAFCKAYKTYIGASLLLVVFLPALAIVGSYVLISPYRQYIVQPSTGTANEVGIVLGAGVDDNGRPYKELRSRLDTGAQALLDGTLRLLLLSGDNRFKGYNEPEAMKQYLLDTYDISADKLVLDYAGRSTYESCERAHLVFGLNRAVLISAPSHLPRAIFLCRHFGIEAYGIASSIEANNHFRRELLARVKAVINVYVYGERTVLGPPITI